MELVEEETKNDLIAKYRKYVVRIVRQLMLRMSIPEEHEDELIAAGYLGLVEAAQRYEAERGIKFRTFSFLRIKGAVIDCLRSLSELSSKSYTYLRVLEALAEPREELNREITESETRSDMLDKIVDYAAKGALAYRLSYANYEEEAADFIENPQDPESILEREQDLVILMSKLKSLPEKEREILEQFYIKGKSLADIGRENVGLSKSWVSRLHARGLSLLKDEFLKVDQEIQ